MAQGLAVVCFFTQAVMAFAGSKTNMRWVPGSASAWDKARESARPVLVEVWADWCPPCRRMDQEVWNQANVIGAADKFVQISFDVSRRDQTRIGGISLGKYGVHTVRVLPTILVLDPWGETLSVYEGFVYSGELMAGLGLVPADYSSVRGQREALLSQRNNSRALTSVGMLYQRNSSFGIATRYFKEALSGSGAKEDEAQREQLQFVIAANEIRLADWRAARKHLEEFRVSFPRSAFLDQVLFGFVVADVRQNKIKDAQQHAAELRSTFPNSTMIVEVNRLLEERSKRH